MPSHKVERHRVPPGVTRGSVSTRIPWRAGRLEEHVVGHAAVRQAPPLQATATRPTDRSQLDATNGGFSADVHSLWIVHLAATAREVVYGSWIRLGCRRWERGCRDGWRRSRVRRAGSRGGADVDDSGGRPAAQTVKVAFEDAASLSRRRWALELTLLPDVEVRGAEKNSCVAPRIGLALVRTLVDRRY